MHLDPVKEAHIKKHLLAKKMDSLDPPFEVSFEQTTARVLVKLHIYVESNSCYTHRTRRRYVRRLLRYYYNIPVNRVSVQQIAHKHPSFRSRIIRRIKIWYGSIR